MTDTLIAFGGMVFLVSLFLIFIVTYGRWVERRQLKSDAPEVRTPAPQVRRRSPVVSRPASPTLTDAMIDWLLRTGRTNAGESVQARSPHQDARSSVQLGASVQRVHGEILPNSREELQQLVAAIQHKRDGKTKQESIERAFGIKKGGSPAWKRASDLFDAATIPPSRFPPLEHPLEQFKVAAGDE